MRAQTLEGWELLAINDGSTDGSGDRLRQWGQEDKRIRLLSFTENRGPAAARNEGLRNAKGDVVTYLDCDDEYYPAYLEMVHHFIAKGDVLIFGYDVVDDSAPERPVKTWAPAAHKNVLFGGNLAAPLGVAHRRDLALKVGGFDEELWGLEDWDLWRRMARTGAEFIFPPYRSGLYHQRPSSRSRSPRLTARQRTIFQGRLNTGGPLYGGKARLERPVKKIALLTTSFPFLGGRSMERDFVAAAHLLGRLGFDCQGFCPSMWDEEGDCDFEAALAAAGLPVQARNTTLGPHAARIVHTRAGQIPVSIFRTQSAWKADHQDSEVRSFLDYFEKFLTAFRPDALLAMCPVGPPDPLFDMSFHVGKCIDVPTVLWLGDESTINPTVLQSTDYCVVNSEHLRQLYWNAMGLVCKTLPMAIDGDRLPRSHLAPHGVTVLARNSPGESRIAAKLVERLKRARPDVSVSTMARDWKSHGTGSPISARGASDAAHIGSTTKVLVVPSFGHGLFDRSVAEAMIHGVPVLVSNRGALPEIVGPAGIVASIPSHYRAGSAREPMADDIAPWADTILRLWDDPAFHQEISNRCAAHSRRWCPILTAPVYEGFFKYLCPQPGPPLLPRWSHDWAASLVLPGA